MKKMKKGLVLGTAAVMAAAAFTACKKTSDNVQDPQTSEISDFSAESNIPEDVYGPPVSEYSSEENIPECVYGPPESFYEDEDGTSGDDFSSDTEDDTSKKDH